MRYPNLVEEYHACGCHISSLASHANVTVEVMGNILRGKDRQKNRSKTFEGIAKAMAEQWTRGRRNDE